MNGEVKFFENSKKNKKIIIIIWGGGGSGRGWCRVGGSG